MDHSFFPLSFFGADGHNSHRANDSSERNFTPLFRLLDDFDRYAGSRPGARATPPMFQPKFDVRETDAAYELHGELPGADRDNIHLEFTDPQTILIRGRVERSYTAGSPASDKPHAGTITEAGEEDQKEKGATTETGEEKKKAGRTSPPLKATVKDEAEEEGTQAAATPDTSVADTAHGHSLLPRTAPKKAPIKYWLTERSIGQFTRTFTFPARVEQEGVAASFKDGILTVVVPKSRKHEARRIVVT